jgi:hypothetical protein
MTNAKIRRKKIIREIKAAEIKTDKSETLAVSLDYLEQPE